MQMEDIIAGLHEQRDRIDAALAALTGDTSAKPKPAEAAKPKPRRKKRQEASKEGRVRPQTLEAIVSAFNGSPMSRDDIRRATGLSPDTIRRGLDAARAADLIRRAGVAANSRTHLYALMPGGGEG